MKIILKVLPSPKQGHRGMACPRMVHGTRSRIDVRIPENKFNQPYLLPSELVESGELDLAGWY